MQTIQIPLFDEKIKFTGFTTVNVKNKIDYKESCKIISRLPGIPVGYCASIYKLGNGVDKIELPRFYDARQKGVNKLKNFYITIIK
jgi:hypothetical protein